MFCFTEVTASALALFSGPASAAGATVLGSASSCSSWVANSSGDGKGSSPSAVRHWESRSYVSKP